MELISSLSLKDDNFITACLGITTISAQIVNGHAERLQKTCQRGRNNALFHVSVLGC